MSDDDCRQAVGQLSDFRWIRAEHLEDGYDVSDVFATVLIVVPNTANAVSRPTRSHSNCERCSSQIHGWHDVSFMKPSWNLREIDTTCSTACAQYANLATSTRAEVEKSLGGRDTSDLTASFRRALSHSIPPPALYRNYRLGPGSRLIFGVPLVQLETDPDNVPKVLRMCIEEAEKKYLNTRGIYSVS